LTTNHPAEDRLNTYLQLVRYTTHAEGIVAVTIAAGRFYDDLSLVLRSYLEAKSALQYRFVFGRNTVILFSDIEKDACCLDGYPAEQLADLARAILRGDAEAAEIIVNHLIGAIRTGKVSLLAARCAAFDILNTCIKTAQRLGIQLNDLHGPGAATATLTQYDTIDDVLSIVRVLIHDLFERIRESGSGDARREHLIGKIHRHLEESFHRTDFSLCEIAENLNLSQSGLSHFYRDATGNTLHDYLNRLRMEKASELLSEGSSLKVVVHSIGLHDMSSFIKQFRKVYGMTPGQYARVYARHR
jgi:AraC-like DNA-binding protein